MTITTYRRPLGHAVTGKEMKLLGYGRYTVRHDQVRTLKHQLAVIIA